jgi:Flp pilus assembly pilin Flp
MQLMSKTIGVGARLMALWCDESGQSVTEYAVVMGVITLVALASISAAGEQTLDILRRTVTSLH